MVGPLGPQPVGRREITVEVTHVNRADRSQLMDDHIGLCVSYGVRHLIWIKRVRHDRHRAKLAQHHLL